MTKTMEVTEELPVRRGLQLLLADHHRRLDAMCRRLLACAEIDDSRELAQRWAELETELLDHMAAEEEVILPSYASHSPDDAARILGDHVRIRALLTPLGVDVELHEVRAAQLQRLVETLEGHATHEDRLMYPWANRNLTQIEQRFLYTRIARWFAQA